MRTLPLAAASAPMNAQSPFSYACNRCNRCCIDKRIRVNPYEVFRLARRTGTSTSHFLAHRTAAGIELAQRDDGACVFLGPRGCTVHEDRPLVCRLYPLARTVREGADDGYFLLEGHPKTEGVFAEGGAVQQYLDAQGATPFMRAADEYFAATLRMNATLDASAPPDGAPAPEGGADVNWLDIDAVLARDASLPPATADEAMTRHIAALDAWRSTFITTRGESI